MISYIAEIAKGIDALLETGQLKKTQKVLLYSLDRYAFAMHTILSHRGINIHAFLSENEGEVLRLRRMVRDFACRFFRSERDVIEMWTLSEIKARRETGIVILLATVAYEKKKTLLEEAGFVENRDFFKVYDFYAQEIDGALLGKQQLSPNEVKQYGKELLAQMDKFCLESGLRYWVCGGTMLGAVRHRGFIPWDDDVDVFMPLPDYFRFLATFPTGERYALSGFGSEAGVDFLLPFAKIVDKETIMDEDLDIVRRLVGVWVDVFPLVGMPDDEEERVLFFRQYREAEKNIIQEFYAKDGDLRVFKDRFPEQEKFLRKYDFDASRYVGVLGTRYGEKDSTHQKIYDKTLRMKFEDIEVNVPAGYEEYLSSLYGSDWNKLPPESERKSLHLAKAYKA